MKFALKLLFLVALLQPASAAGLQFPPFKDRYFAYPALISSEFDRAYRVFDYQEIRDINGRDDIPEKRARRDYVSLSVRRHQRDLVLKTATGTIRHFAVGRTARASVIVIYLHGQGGSRKQGVDDWTFGGNFNRIKNLAVAAGGLYLSPDFSDFGVRGAGEIATLIAQYAAASPHAPVFVACGSMGGQLCWMLARDPSLAPRLGGLLLLGSMWDGGFLKSAAFRASVPLFIAQGSKDTVFPVDRQEAFFRSILAAKPDYPVRFVRFETGTHGTPIRMSDWRETLNWMLSARRQR